MRQEMFVSITADGSNDELDSLRIELSEELAELPISAVGPATTGDVPDNARALEAIAIGKLIVEFAPEAAKAVARTIHSWFQRSVARSVTLTIEGDSITLSRASTSEQERLLEVFIAKHQTN
jgi:hypothetical protein